MKQISFSRLRGLAFIIWHARHEFYHVLLGLAWAWVLREVWGNLNLKWILLSVFGSLLPDTEHLFFFLSYGKKDKYTQMIRVFLKNHEWRVLAVFMEHGHKRNTKLAFHNMYVIILLLVIVTAAILYDWNSWVVVIGAMIIHYIFDIFDDIVTLGRINPNWKRWGRGEIKETENTTD